MVELDSFIVSHPEVLVYCGYMGVAAFGGVAYQLWSNYDNTFGNMLRSVVVAAFSGLMTGIGCSHYDISQTAGMMLSGIIGFISSFGLLWVVAAVLEKVGVSSKVTDRLINVDAQGAKHTHEANAILTRLLQEDLLTHEQYAKFLDGDTTQFHILLSRGKISGKEYFCVCSWRDELTVKNAERAKNKGDE